MTTPRRLPDDAPGAVPTPRVERVPTAVPPFKPGDLANWGGIKVHVDGTSVLYGEPRYMVTDEQNHSFLLRWEDLTPWEEIHVDPEGT